MISRSTSSPRITKSSSRTRLSSERHIETTILSFAEPNGDFYSPDHMGTRTKVLLRKAGYSEFSLHSLRHSHPSILLVNGTPLAVVSERLGHSDQNLTVGVYSHCLPSDRKTASRVWHTALADILSKPACGNPHNTYESHNQLQEQQSET